MTIKELENQISNLQTELEKLKKIEVENRKLKPWEVGLSREHYYLYTDGSVIKNEDDNIGYDWERFSFGNYYRTNELAEQDAKELKLRNKIRLYRDMLCENYKYNPCKSNWYIVFCNELVKYGVVSTTAIEEIGQIYFDTQEHAQMVCDILNAELNSYMT